MTAAVAQTCWAPPEQVVADGSKTGRPWIAGLVGTLRHDCDTARLTELGFAYYDFPATDHHGAETVCYSRDEFAAGLVVTPEHRAKCPACASKTAAL